MRSRRADAIEVAGFSAALLVLLWDPWEWLPGAVPWAGTIQTAAVAAALAVLAVSLGRTRPGARGLGLAPSQWGRGWSPIAGFTLGGLAVLAIVGTLWAEPSPDLLRRGWLTHYVLGVAGQQLLLQGLFNERLTSLAGDRAGPAAAALLFAGFHVPNAWLVAVTLPAGLFWTLHFRRHRNLAATFCSQLILGAGAMALLGEGPLLHLRVGLGALRWLQP